MCKIILVKTSVYYVPGTVQSASYQLYEVVIIIRKLRGLRENYVIK